MEKYEVSGMSCAACVARVEKAVSKIPGVKNCSVSLLTNSMGVEGSVSDGEIVEAVKNAGYSAKKIEKKQKGTKSVSESADEDLLKDKETPVLKKRLAWSAAFLIALMYISMGHTMLNLPIPQWFVRNGENYVALGILEMLLSAIVIVINKKFFISGFRGLMHKSPNMDTLVAMGSGVSFIYSTIVLLEMTNASAIGNSEHLAHLAHNLYFESAAMIVTLITVGKLLESVSKGKTTTALKSLMKLSPKTATLLQDGKETEVSIENVQVGDIFIVRPGESLPVDGEIIEGNTAINESALTGESIPVDKSPGSQVSAATINQSGFIKCKATRIGEDTTISKIIQMVSDAASTKAPIAKIADKVSGIFVPTVIGIAIITFFTWLVLGAEFSFSLNRAISVLVVSCPCALGLATPVAIMVGNGMGAKNGILFKTSESLELAGRVQIVLLDKTGTITKGEPVVTDIFPADIPQKDFLERIAALEAKSEHPLAKAIMRKAADERIETKEAFDFEALPGNGLFATVDGKKVFGGNEKFIEKSAGFVLDDKTKMRMEKLSAEGKTPLIFAEDKKLLGIVAVADAVKEESPKAIAELKSMGLKVVLLTGDNKKTAEAVGAKTGIDEIISEVLPDGKENVVKEFKKKRRVCMVGDGINDAPALTSSDIGMAIGAGTDVAIDAADIVLVKNSLLDVSAAIRLGRKTLRNVKENLFWAFFYNIILIPIAAGVYHKWLGLDMNPMFGAAAMSLSSFCVVTNALRLNFAKIRSDESGKKINKTNRKIKEVGMTEKTLKVEGMMCQHCERHVKEALEKINGVASAAASHENKTAVVQLTKEVPSAEFEKAILEAGYKYIAQN